MSADTTWKVGAWLNSIQSTFVGLLRVLSVPIVLALSVASGYTTYYGLSFFITPWIAIVVTAAVQSILVICSLELAGIHWRANPPRYFMVTMTLLVAITVSISFSYFKFYEFSRKDSLIIERQSAITNDISRYLNDVAHQKSLLTSELQKRVEKANNEATKAYLGSHPGMRESRNQVGRGKVWSYYNGLLQAEQAKLKQLDSRFQGIDRITREVRAAIQEMSLNMSNPAPYNKLAGAYQELQIEAENLAATSGIAPLTAPRLPPFAEFSQGMTPSFAMWRDISWFALACAAMVDFFTLILSYRLETTAPGPLNEREKELAFQGIRQFGEFTINANDELEFVIEKSEIERARRVPDWSRMFSVALLLNRGYLRKMSDRTVEFAPNLYPIIAEKMAGLELDRSQSAQPGDAALAHALKKRELRHG